MPAPGCLTSGVEIRRAAGPGVPGVACPVPDAGPGPWRMAAGRVRLRCARVWPPKPVGPCHAVASAAGVDGVGVRRLRPVQRLESVSEPFAGDAVRGSRGGVFCREGDPALSCSTWNRRDRNFASSGDPGSRRAAPRRFRAGLSGAEARQPAACALLRSFHVERVASGRCHRRRRRAPCAQPRSGHHDSRQSLRQPPALHRAGSTGPAGRADVARGTEWLGQDFRARGHLSSGTGAIVSYTQQ
jgi:hypothetical protein